MVDVMGGGIFYDGFFCVGVGCSILIGGVIIMKKHTSVQYKIVVDIYDWWENKHKRVKAHDNDCVSTFIYI